MSVSSNSHSLSSASSSASALERRARMLGELDIDVWQLRVAGSVTAEPLVSQAAVHNPAAPATPEGAPRSGAGPAAAMALLEEAATPGRASSSSAQPRPPQVASPATADLSVPAESANASAPAEGPVSQPAPQFTPEPPLDLWCLSGEQGVLLANFAGLSPLSQRFLNDVFQATLRLLAAAELLPALTPSQRENSR